MPKNKKLSPQSIIIVGGEGTRLQPLTFKTPKPLLPIGGLSVIEYQINKLKTLDITHVALATGYKAEMFKKYFQNGKAFNLSIKYAYEETPLGTGGAIRNAYNTLPLTDPETPVIIWNGDIISNIDLEKMLNKFYSTKSDLMIYLTPVENPRMYGLVELGINNEILKFVEKPTVRTKINTNLVNAGCYIIKRKLLDKFFPQNVSISVEREIFPSLIKEDIKTFGYTTEDLWVDIGTPEKYLKTNMLAAEGKILGITLPENKYVTVHGSNGLTIISNNAVIHGTSTIINSMIEDGTKVGENTTIIDSFVGRNTHIGSNTTITGAIIGDGAHIGDLNEIPSGARINHHARIEKQAIRFTNI
jgi:mannose-1-phosphate guanylyltransferase